MSVFFPLTIPAVQQSKYTSNPVSIGSWEGILRALNELYSVSHIHKTKVSGYLQPRVVLLGRSIPEGGGGKGTSSQSSESGGGKFISRLSGDGSSFPGDAGVGSTLLSSASSRVFPSDREVIERVMNLGTKSASSSLRDSWKLMYSNSDARWFAHC